MLRIRLKAAASYLFEAIRIEVSDTGLNDQFKRLDLRAL